MKQAAVILLIAVGIASLVGFYDHSYSKMREEERRSAQYWNTRLSAIKEEGYKAGKAGLDRLTNPYPEYWDEHSEHTAWSRGWVEGRIDFQKP
jgi:ribosome modulation factor